MTVGTTRAWRLVCGFLLVAALQTRPAGQAVAAPCVSCDLRFDLTIEKDSYEVGEPIGLSIRLTNATTDQVSVRHTSDVTGRHDGYRFDVFDEAGSLVADPGLRSLSLLGALGSLFPLAPGTSDRRHFLANYQVAPLKPGRYSIKGRYASEFPQPGLHAESNTVSIRIAATPASRIRERVADLIRQIDGDARRIAPLLGFTGDPAAIPPLVDLLYRKDDGVQAAAVDAMLYFDRRTVDQALLTALKDRGPRGRMVYFLTPVLRVPDAETRRFLLKALGDRDADARAAAVEGLAISNRPPDPKLFAQLAAMLTDPVATVRHQASLAVVTYHNDQTLERLAPLVFDGDPTVAEQAAICIGWMAQAAAPGSQMRNKAIELLRSVATSSPIPTVRERAVYWLARARGQ